MNEPTSREVRCYGDRPEYPLLLVELDAYDHWVSFKVWEIDSWTLEGEPLWMDEDHKEARADDFPIEGHSPHW